MSNRARFGRSSRLAGLALLLASLLAIAVAGEAGIRGLQRLGLTPRISGDTVFPTHDWTARLVRSANPVLHVEHDPDDPLVNAHGFRGEDWSVEKPQGTFRIAALGDSVTFGIGVPLEQTFPFLLETLLQQGARPSRRFEVLNLGVSSWGIHQLLEIYRKRVRHYDPDLLLVGYVLNDPLSPETLTRALGEYFGRRRRLERFARRSQFLAFLWLRVDFLLDRRRRQASYENIYRDERLWGRAAQALGTLGELTREDGVALLVVVFPIFDDFEDYGFEREHGLIAEELERRGIARLDLLPLYRERPAATFQLNPSDTTHPNGAGHRLAADGIARYLREGTLLDRERVHGRAGAAGQGQALGDQ